MIETQNDSVNSINAILKRNPETSDIIKNRELIKKERNLFRLFSHKVEASLSNCSLDEEPIISKLNDIWDEAEDVAKAIQKITKYRLSIKNDSDYTPAEKEIVYTIIERFVKLLPDDGFYREQRKSALTS